MPLTQLTTQVLEACFAESPFRAEIRFQLEVGGFTSERTALSIIRIVLKDPDQLAAAIDLAGLDWRDLYVRAGHGEDVDAHIIWAKGILARPPLSRKQPSPEIFVVPNQYGYVKCPKCGRSFQIKKQNNFWNGDSHTSCGQRLKVSEK